MSKAMEAAERLGSGFSVMDLGDFVDDAVTVSGDAKALGAPDGADISRSLDIMLGQRLSDDWAASMESLRRGYDRDESAYHDSARRGIIRATGVSDEAYDAAVAASLAGDPSPLMRLRCTYLDTI